MRIRSVHEDFLVIRVLCALGLCVLRSSVACILCVVRATMCTGRDEQRAQPLLTQEAIFIRGSNLEDYIDMFSAES